MISTETVWVALLERFRNRAGIFKTIVRGSSDRHYSPEELPALEVWDNGNEEPQGQEEGRLIGYTISGDLIALAKANEERDLSPFSSLNAALAEMRSALERKAGDRDTSGTAFQGQNQTSHFTTLGGLIAELRVGTTQKGGGAQQGTAVAITAIQMDIGNGDE